MTSCCLPLASKRLFTSTLLWFMLMRAAKFSDSERAAYHNIECVLLHCCVIGALGHIVC